MMDTALIGLHPFGHDITTEQLSAQFNALHQWEDRYRLLVQLARQLPALPEEEKRQQLEINGCENRVWLGYQQLNDGRLHFYGDSEGRIVRGLLAVLLTFIEGKTASQLRETDISAWFTNLGISQNISASRYAGLHALADAVRQIAEHS